MTSFSISAVVDAPVDQVYSIISNPNRISEWRTDVLEISNLSGPTNVGATVGATFVETVNFMGRKRLAMRFTEVEPNRRLVIRAESGMSVLPTQAFTLTPEGGKSKITLDVDLRITGFLTLMAPLFPAQFKKIWAKYFENLNALVKK
jgi:uncharacterized protein YndB with AHSA1/START domain